MIIETEQERLLVISDLHIGHPYSVASRNLVTFFEYARQGRYNVCINGDGFEILQARFAHLAADATIVLRSLQRLLKSGLSVFYVIGNHDIVLENFVTAWDGVQITPFLNVTSGGSRIRVEHGHLYDPSFVRNPRLYEWLTRALGPLLRLFPDVYRLWSSFEELRQKVRRRKSPSASIDGLYREAAHMLLKRGFDVVVFGHTHRAEDVTLEPGRRYLNSGTWLRGGSYVQIEGGQVSLREWPGEGHAGDAHGQGARSATPG
jgi:UDP-2,3-diacylglucosamine pyrophosphatase LpxH